MGQRLGSLGPEGVLEQLPRPEVRRCPMLGWRSAVDGGMRRRYRWVSDNNALGQMGRLGSRQQPTRWLVKRGTHQKKQQLCERNILESSKLRSHVVELERHSARELVDAFLERVIS